MAFFDFPLEVLETYRPELAVPEDFDEFWERTLADNCFEAGAVSRREQETALTGAMVWDVTFPGFGGHPIKAWLTIPAVPEGPLPAIVEYIGYGGGRGFPEERSVWPSAGYAHLYVDTRGQGSTWGSGGDTADLGPAGSAHPGVMTRGIERPEDYYYRRLFVDAHHAVTAMSTFPEVDSTRIVVTGGSQGGALSIAAASLNHRVIGAMPDVPFLSNFPRAIGLTDDYPYQEVVNYLSVKRDRIESVFKTLSYFDCAILGRRAVSPALFSVGLMDGVAPPSTVFAARNWYGGDSEIAVYPYNGHEGGAGYQLRRQLEWAGAVTAV